MEDVKQKLDSELLILVDSSCNLNELKSIIKQKSKIITFDYESHILLKENNTEHLVSDIFVKDFHIAQKTCYRLSKWFNDKSISTDLEYKGINLGSLIQEEFRFFLVPYVKKFIEIIEIHKKFKDSEILASPLIYELIICFSDKVKKIGNRQTEINFLNDSISIKITKNTTLRLPAHLYNILKCLSEKILTPIFGLKKNNTKNILLVEFNSIRFRRFIKILNMHGLTPVFYNQRRPVIWNVSSLLSIIFSNSKILSEHNTNKVRNSDIQNKRAVTLKRINDLFANDLLFSKIFKILDDKSIWMFIKPHLIELCQRRISEALKTIDVTNSFLKEYKFEHILLLSEIGFNEQIVIKLAKMNNIVVTLMQHGLYSDGKNSFDYNDNAGVIPNHCDKMIVWGEIMRDYLVKHGVQPQKIVTLGSPIFDHLFSLREKEQEKFILLAVTPPFQNLISELSIDTIERYHQSINLIAKIAANMNKKLVIKLHPSVQEKEITYLKNNNPYGFVIATKKEISCLIGECEIFLVTDFSTSILESAILMKPTILIQIRDFYKDSSFYRTFLTLNESNMQDILDALIRDRGHRLRLIENGKKFLCDYLDNPGNGAESVVGFLNKNTK